MTIWAFNRAVSRRLLVWSGFSIACGLVLVLAVRAGSSAPFWRGVGVQAVPWGAVDAGIALVGDWMTQRRRRSLADPMAEDVLAGEARTLRRLLWVNTGLDVLYVVGGVLLALTLGADDPFWRGNGWGIVIQGGFLLLFDLFHALGVPGPESARG